jgi:hypothetical protein
MTHRALLPTLVLSACLAACGTTMTAAPAGFLSSYANLAGEPDAMQRTMRPAAAIDGSRLKLGDVQWIGTNLNVDITTAEQAALVGLLRSQLNDSCQPCRSRLADVLW